MASKKAGRKQKACREEGIHGRENQTQRRDFLLILMGDSAAHRPLENQRLRGHVSRLFRSLRNYERLIIFQNQILESRFTIRSMPLAITEKESSTKCLQEKGTPR